MNTNLPSFLWARLLRVPQQFWFRPALLLVVVIALLGLGQVMLPQSDTFNALVEGWMKPELARSVLTTLAGASATVMALVFSMTFVAMSTVAAQLGPRLLYDIDADPVTQWVAGLFLSAFATALIGLLQPITDSGASGQVIVALISAVLTFASLMALLYYIHHLARQLTTDAVLFKRAEIFRHRLGEIFPDQSASPTSPLDPKSAGRDTAEVFENRTCIEAPQSGYVDQIARDQLVRLARDHALDVLVLVKPGQYVLSGESIITAAPLGLSADRRRELADCLSLAQERRFTEDLEKDLDSILEIMLRALSPGINDPHTAIAGLHQIGGAMSDVMARRRSDGQINGDGWSIQFEITQLEDLIRKVCRSLRSVVADQLIVMDVLADMLDRLGRMSTGSVSDLCMEELRRVQALAEKSAALPVDRTLLRSPHAGASVPD